MNLRKIIIKEEIDLGNVVLESGDTIFIELKEEYKNIKDYIMWLKKEKTDKVIDSKYYSSEPTLDGFSRKAFYVILETSIYDEEYDEGTTYITYNVLNLLENFHKEFFNEKEAINYLKKILSDRFDKILTDRELEKLEKRR